jgi:transposase-like protein
MKFILEWERRWKASKGRIDVAELSRLYGVSRQTAHVWIRRYQDAGHDLRAMQERSRRASSNPRAVSLDMQGRLVAARKQPSVSGIGAVLRRRAMTAARKPRRGTALCATIAPPFADCCVVRRSQSPMAISSDISSTRPFENMGYRHGCAPTGDHRPSRRHLLRACRNSAWSCYVWVSPSSAFIGT